MDYSPELLALMKQYWEDSNPHNSKAWNRFGLEMLNEARAGEALDLVSASVPFALTGRRLLEVGSGVGAVQLVARRRGVDAFGVEPSFLGARASRKLSEGRGAAGGTVVCGVGETIPFGDDVFDVVCSFQVLEHTRQPARVLDESIRVLRPGGWFVHVFPNYGSIWEGHYGVPWVPHLPKRLGRLYLRLLGRDPSMIDECQLLTHGSVARILARHPQARVVDWGIALWERRIRTLEFSEWGYVGRLKAAVKLLHRLRLVDPVIRLGRELQFETPIVLVGTKVTSSVAAPMSRVASVV